MQIRDEQFAEQLARQRAAAESQLWKSMEERGMTREGGWRVAEFTRETRGGTELVLRPLHLWHDSPYDLECVIAMSDNGTIDSSSAPEPMRRDHIART